MTYTVELVSSPRPLQGEAESLGRHGWIDTSYADDRAAIGHLRMPGVNNGNYGWRHPIQSVDGDGVGYLTQGSTSLGYTYCCVYADRARCFFVSHVPFSTRSTHSYISTLSDTGSFLFRPGSRKFKRTQSIELPTWVGHEVAFKLMNNQEHLLFLAQGGFCFVDTARRRAISKTDFGGLSYSLSGFGLSPKVNLLAVCFSLAEGVDPLDGQSRYGNLIHLYNLDNGALVGQARLSSDRYEKWNIVFGLDGRRLSTRSATSDLTFDLEVRS